MKEAWSIWQLATPWIHIGPETVEASDITARGLGIACKHTLRVDTQHFAIRHERPDIDVTSMRSSTVIYPIGPVSVMM